MPFKWQSAIRLTQNELTPYANWSLTKVNAGYDADNGQLECNATVIIYGEGNATPSRGGTIECYHLSF